VEPKLSALAENEAIAEVISFQEFANPVVE
jgi:hypothetical protein